MADFDLQLDLAIDALSTAVEAVTPPKLAAFPFQRYRGATPFDDADDSAIRAFLWDTAGDLVMTGSPSDGDRGPSQDGEGTWYRLDLLLRIRYPKWWVPEGDTNARGADVLQLGDVLAITDRLTQQDPLGAGAMTLGYFAVELRRANRVGQVRQALYKLLWLEQRITG